jgi:hypothetical protein
MKQNNVSKQVTCHATSHLLHGKLLIGNKSPQRKFNLSLEDYHAMKQAPVRVSALAGPQ